MNADEQRSIEFAKRFHTQLADRIVPFTWGSAFLEDDFPLRYGSNFLWVDGAPQDATVEGLIGEADRILGGEGFEHRIVGIDDRALTEELAPGFGEAGWDRHQLIVMVLQETTTERTAGAARQVTHEEAYPLLEKLQHTYTPPRSPDAAKMLADYPAKLESVVGAQFFAAEASDGALAAICDLYIDGTDAEIESVNTLPDYRKQGLGNQIMFAAIDAARRQGAEWIHLIAEEDDWPQHWYERLGFKTVGSYCQFQKFPPR